jgi:hypothetical protein
LVSLRGVFTLVFQLAILPGVSWLLEQKVGLGAVVKDLWMARATIFGLLGGALLIAFSATPEMMIFCTSPISTSPRREYTTRCWE